MDSELNWIWIKNWLNKNCWNLVWVANCVANRYSRNQIIKHPDCKHVKTSRKWSVCFVFTWEAPAALWRQINNLDGLIITWLWQENKHSKRKKTINRFGDTTKWETCCFSPGSWGNWRSSSTGSNQFEISSSLCLFVGRAKMFFRLRNVSVDKSRKHVGSEVDFSPGATWEAENFVQGRKFEIYSGH